MIGSSVQIFSRASIENRTSSEKQRGSFLRQRGAGFPAHIKLNPATPVDILCINGAECEPYITADEHEFLENYENVIYGITQVKKYLGVEKVLIGIEGNKPGAIALMKEKTAEYDYISVVTLPARYPQGAEKVLIDQMTSTSSIFILLNQFESFFNRNTKIGTFVQGFESYDVPEYPIEAVREAFVNALAHRDYSLTDDCITFYIYDDRIFSLSHK